MAMSEGGHMLVEYDGRLREWESFASGRAIKATYGKYARDITSHHVWVQIADKISRGFLAMIPLVMPDVIIIGGSIGAYYDRYKEPLKNTSPTSYQLTSPCPRSIKQNIQRRLFYMAATTMAFKSLLRQLKSNYPALHFAEEMITSGRPTKLLSITAQVVPMQFCYFMRQHTRFSVMRAIVKILN